MSHAVGAKTGWPGSNILWLDGIGSWTSNCGNVYNGPSRSVPEINKPVDVGALRGDTLVTSLSRKIV